MISKKDRSEKRYGDTWNTRKDSLNGMTYDEYLKTDHWFSIKRKARKRKYYQKCELCPETKIELHHKTYKFINTPQELQSIIPLCRYHHQEIHDYAKKYNLSVRIATNSVVKYSKRVYGVNRVVKQP